jgi:hypothetical protein
MSHYPSVVSQMFVEHVSPRRGRKLVAHGVSRGFVRLSLTPVPSPARAGEGCRRQGEGRPTQGSRPGLLYAAPDGAAEAWPNRHDLYRELSGHGTSSYPNRAP